MKIKDSHIISEGVVKIKKRVFGLKLVYTDHFLERVEERNINVDEIFWILLNRYKEVRLYRGTGKQLIYMSQRLSFLFRVRKTCIELITAMDYEPKTIKGLMVI